MWALLPPTKQLLVVVALTVFIILGLEGLSLWWAGERPPLLKMVSTIALIIGVVIAAFANWIWRWLWRRLPWLNKAFFPDLNGVWVGHVQTTWKDPTTAELPGPIPSSVTIRQTLFDISIKQVTGESTSYSTRVIAESDPKADRYRFWYSYDNRPKAEFHFRSTQHEGVAWLEISLADAPDRLNGQYFTSRRSTGDMHLVRDQPS